MFDDLDYPGRRVPVQRKKVVTKPPPHWSDNPTRYPYNGEMRDFYTIGHVALALNKSPVTIRSWETKGMLPKSALRSPRPKRSPLGTQPKGRRLWTYDQIEGIVRIAEEEKCILNGLPPTLKFTKKVDKLFTKLNTQLQREGKR